MLSIIKRTSEKLDNKVPQPLKKHKKAIVDESKDEEEEEEEYETERVNQYSTLLEVEKDPISDQNIVDEAEKIKSRQQFFSRIPIFKQEGFSAVASKQLTATDLYFLVDPEWQATIKRWRDIPIQCARCKQNYYEIDNIGTWKCTQHARPWNYDYKGSFRERGMWDCCGDECKIYPRGESRGCVKADHSPADVPYTRMDDLIIPAIIQNFVALNSQSVIVNEYHHMVQSNSDDEPSIVRRYDWIEDEFRRSNGKSTHDTSIYNGVMIDRKWLTAYCF